MSACNLPGRYFSKQDALTRSAPKTGGGNQVLHGLPGHSLPEQMTKTRHDGVPACSSFYICTPVANTDTDFKSRNQLDNTTLTKLFSWTEAEFLKRFEGSPIRRIGYRNWLRNIAVALGNAQKTSANLNALRARENHPDSRIREHIHWAIQQQL